MAIKKENLFIYFIAGIIATIIIYISVSLLKDETTNNSIQGHVWAAETDSLFVRTCYTKYKPQIKEDIQKRELTKFFCRCMLEKVKIKYSEENMNNVTNEEIKKWDIECREQIKKPDNIKIQ